MGITGNIIRALSYTLAVPTMEFISISEKHSKDYLTVSHCEYEKLTNLKTVYNYNVVTLKNANMSMKWFKNHVLLIVNIGRYSKHVD